MTSQILIVDDKPENLKVLSDMLTRRGYSVRAVTSGTMALRTVDHTLPDLIMLDVMMPNDIDGYETCRRLKANLSTRDVPVIFISALDSPVDKVRAFEVGGNDYITKPFYLEEVQARVENQLKLVAQRREIESLREADRRYYAKLNEYKEDLLRSTTHDLKTPLSTITGYAYLLLEHDVILSDEQLRRYVEFIAGASERMADMIHDMLEAARIEAALNTSRERVNLQQFLVDCLSDIEAPATQKTIDLIADLDTEDVDVWIDPAYMRRAITNLLTNAVKYTPRNGEIYLTAQPMSDETVAIQIRDTGIGIPQDALPRIFDRFYRVDSPVHSREKGTGLGLSIAKSVIEQHYGSLEVDSILHEGTQFTITLPR